MHQTSSQRSVGVSSDAQTRPGFTQMLIMNKYILCAVQKLPIPPRSNQYAKLLLHNYQREMHLANRIGPLQVTALGHLRATQCPLVT